MIKKAFIAFVCQFFSYASDIMANLVDADYLKISNDELAVVNEIFKYLALIGVGLTIVYFIIELNRRWALEGGDMNMKSFGAPFLKLGMALVILCNAPTIVGYICDINNAFIDKGAELAGTTSSTYADDEGNNIDFSEDGDFKDGQNIGEYFYEQCKGFSVLILIGIALVCLVFIIVATIIDLAFTYKSFLYKIEFLFRVGFSSIAFADVYSGQNSGTIRWCKSFIAFGLYGLAFAVLPAIVFGTTSTYVVNSITSGVNGIADIAKSFCLMAICPIIALGLINTVKQITKEAVA